MYRVRLDNEDYKEVDTEADEEKEHVEHF